MKKIGKTSVLKKGDQKITQFFNPSRSKGKDVLSLGSPQQKVSTDAIAALHEAESLPSLIAKKPKRPLSLPSSQQTSVVEVFMKGVLKTEKKQNMGGVVKCRVFQNPGSLRVIVRRLPFEYKSEGGTDSNVMKSIKVSSSPEMATSATREDISSKWRMEDCRSSKNSLWHKSLPSKREKLLPPNSLDVLKYSGKKTVESKLYPRPRLSLRKLRHQQGPFKPEFQTTLQAYKKERELKKLRMEQGKHPSFSSTKPLSGHIVNQSHQISNFKRAYSLPSTSFTGSSSLSSPKESIPKQVTKKPPRGTPAEGNEMCSHQVIHRLHSYPPLCDRKSSMGTFQPRFPAGRPVSCSKDIVMKKRKLISVDERIQKKRKCLSVPPHLDTPFHKRKRGSRMAKKYSNGVTETACHGVLKDHNNGVLEGQDTTAAQVDDFADSNCCLGVDSSLDEETSTCSSVNSYPRVSTEERAKTTLGCVISSKENRSAEYLNRRSLVPFDSKRTQRPDFTFVPISGVDEDSKSVLPSQEKWLSERPGTLQSSESNRVSERQQRDTCNSVDSDSDFHLNLDTDEEGETLMALNDLLTLHTKTKPISTTHEKCSIAVHSSVPSLPLARMSFPNAGKSATYSNSFDRLIKEKKRSESKRETQLNELKRKLQNEFDTLNLSCLTEEDDEQSLDGDLESIPDEHREFFRKFSVKSDGIPDLRPGEKIFNLLKSGAFFNQHNLTLSRSELTPQNFLERTLISPGSSHLELLFTNGVVSQTYASSPCPQPVWELLFKMMTVHSDYVVSMHIFKALWGICTNTTNKIDKNGASKFKVWTPSLLDIVAVFMNLGAPFHALFPLSHLQPDFTEQDIISRQHSNENHLEDHLVTPQREPIFTSLPEYNITNVVKFLLLCTSMYPEVYSDKELVLLISLGGRISLEQDMTPNKDFQCLLNNLLSNIREWNVQMFELCTILSNLSEHHHNLSYLVQLIPDGSTRGRQLRRHLSLVIISKLLNKEGICMPKDPDMKIAQLGQFMYQMKPSSLLKTLEANVQSEQQAPQKEQTMPTEPDQQAYYLCYNLLILANEVMHMDHIPSCQRNHLIQLCTQIEKHIKCDIREDPKLLYRSKVKDLEARTYVKWQELLQRSRPLQGKLHDYWEPVCEEITQSSVVEELKASDGNNAVEAEHYTERDTK
ncbi:SMC5-SMC6 complex localization factor protein 2 [Callorhinchus milii]|uniref:SMC5-SMC6 complex localization factor protein 2 n=1 Tax=Callorhinchus milii TaxID=7868 RepID=UPI001C3F5837|nr:SMC5-SMC6 complex localization factor protein 2 [Callorhinchus milii]